MGTWSGSIPRLWHELMRLTHTLTKTEASSAKVMTEDVPFFMIVKQTACQKEEEPNKTCFNIDHHVHVILEKQVRHDDQS